jgi:hypothetical protein
MSEVHSTPAADSSPEATAKQPKERPAHKGVFPTLEDAQAVKPESETRLRVFEVLKDGTSLGFAWGGQVNEAIIEAARRDGYTARVAEPMGTGLLTKDRVGARLVDFSDEELAAMGLARKKARK